ncbi:hypothetical protein LCGC14_1903690 [marine sediment metagenome]|uniref:Tetratricopeptide repeat protein n=1 Tax=marine sediment metagenome TaxID=412755 RepID=A0A0F9ITW0_9ZZZZ
MRYVLVMIIGHFGCATVQTDILTPISQSIEKPVTTPIIPQKELGAGDYLKLGLMFYYKGQYQQAVDLFALSIDTGDLNNAGRALVYWHAAVCWNQMDNKDLAAEAYHSFVVTAQDIFSILEDNKHATIGGENFVTDFELEEKIVEASTYMHALWVLRNDYGKSLDNPIITKNMSEAKYFIKAIMGFCGKMCNLVKQVLTEDDRIVKPYVVRITVSNNSKNSTDTFFIVIKEEQK